MIKEMKSLVWRMEKTKHDAGEAEKNHVEKNDVQSNKGIIIETYRSKLGTKKSSTENG